MVQEQDHQNDGKFGPVRFSENWDTADAVLKDGVEIDGLVTAFEEKPDPRDDEHSIFKIGYEYEVDGQLFQKELQFSINTVHIIYGYEGSLVRTPKLKYSLGDFKNAMQPGQNLKLRLLPKSPYWFLVEFNKVMFEVMRHDAVWS